MEAYRSYQEGRRAKNGRQQVRWSSLYLGQGRFRPASSSKIKRAIRKGIPGDLRPEAWYRFSGAADLRRAAPGVYLELARKAVASRIFELEVGQVFVSNVSFGQLMLASAVEEGKLIQGRQALARILICVARHRQLRSLPSSFHTIAAAVLLVVKEEEMTFWLLVAILERSSSSPGTPDYFSTTGRACSVEQDVLWSLLEKKQAGLHGHLKACGIEGLQALTGAWTASLFIEHLPFDTVLRLLDTFLYEGPKVLLRMGLALFRLNSPQLRGTTDLFGLKKAIMELPEGQLDVDGLWAAAFDGIGSMSVGTIDRLRRRALDRWFTQAGGARATQDSPGALDMFLTCEPEGVSDEVPRSPILPQAVGAPPQKTPSLHIECSRSMLASGEWSSTPISVSPPRFRRTTCQLSPAQLDPLLDEEDY